MLVNQRRKTSFLRLVSIAIRLISSFASTSPVSYQSPGYWIPERSARASRRQTSKTSCYFYMLPVEPPKETRDSKPWKVKFVLDVYFLTLLWRFLLWKSCGKLFFTSLPRVPSPSLQVLSRTPTQCTCIRFHTSPVITTCTF